MLVPVIGLVQFGDQAEADRFTYLPQIGLAIALAWTAADACRTWPRFRPIWAVAATCVVMILAVSAWRQTSLLARQRDALDLRPGLHFAKHGGPQQPRHRFGGWRTDRRGDRAVPKALEIKPDYVEAHDNLGIVLAGCGRIDEAIEHYQQGAGHRSRLRQSPQQPRHRVCSTAGERTKRWRSFRRRWNSIRASWKPK